MAVLKGIKLSDSDELYQLDYDKAIANKPTLVKSFNDLEDKPFEASVNEADVLAKADYTFEDMAYMHTTLFGLVVGETYFVEWDGTTYECVCQEFSNDGGTFNYIGDIEEENPDIPFMMLDNPAYSMGMIGAKDKETTHNVRIYQSKEVIQYLDPKFIKDMYHDQKEIKVTLAEEQTYEITLASTVEGTYLTADISLGLEEAKTYYIVFDGEEYECEATIISKISDGETVNALVLGNQALNDTTQTDTGEPFFYAKFIGYNLENLTVSTSGTHTLAVKTKELGIEYIKPKYIKDMYSEEITDYIPKQILPFFAPYGSVYAWMASGVIGIEVGETYFVEWDGTTYELVAKDYNNGYGIALGNLSTASAGDDTGEPFVFAQILDDTDGATLSYGFNTLDTSSEHEVHLYSKKVNQIPSKYVDGYTKAEIDEMLGVYVDEVNTLLGGE